MDILTTRKIIKIVAIRHVSWVYNYQNNFFGLGLPLLSLQRSPDLVAKFQGKGKGERKRERVGRMGKKAKEKEGLLPPKTP